MANSRQIAKDLFGKPLRHRRPRFERALERVERATLPARAERIRWLERVIPRNRAYAMPLETYYVFEEARSSFVYGCFVASTLLSAAFVEHWLGTRLAQCGHTKEAERGLAAIVECCRCHDILIPVLVDRIDRLRVIRNPFVHLKSFDHPHTLGRRSVSLRAHPEQLLEQDAKESLITMYTVATYAFPNT